MASPLIELLGEAAGAADPARDDDRNRGRILDAALREAAAVGLDRITVEDVVRRAGLGRMTVYRRFPRRDDLVRALVLRETQRFLTAVSAGIDRADDPEDAIAEAFVAALSFAREHPMLQRLAHSDPGAVAETVAADDAAILSMGSAFIARRIHGAAPGAPSRRTQRVADTLARLFLTYLAIPPTDPDPASDAQLRSFAREVLTPLIAAGRARARPSAPGR